MRYITIVLGLLMALFAAVQYNDPDGPLWAIIYLVPAVWAAIAAFRPAWIDRPPVRALLAACLLAAIAGVVHYWPETPRWWAKDVWWEAETAREGMGMMLVAIVLAVAWTSAWKRRARGTP